MFHLDLVQNKFNAVDVLEETCKIAKQALLNKEINLKQLFKKSYSPTHHFYNFERKQQNVGSPSQASLRVTEVYALCIYRL